MANIFFPVELTPLWIWYEVAESLRVLRQNRAQHVSLESSVGRCLHWSRATSLSPCWLEEGKTDCGKNGREKAGASSPHRKALDTSPYSELTSGLVRHLCCLLLKRSKAFPAFSEKVCYSTPKNTNQIKQLPCLRPFAGFPSFLG